MLYVTPFLCTHPHHAIRYSISVYSPSPCYTLLHFCVLILTMLYVTPFLCTHPHHAIRYSISVYSPSPCYTLLHFCVLTLTMLYVTPFLCTHPHHAIRYSISVYSPSPCYTLLHFCVLIHFPASIQDRIVAQRRPHSRSALSLSSFCQIALETEAMLVWLDTDGS